ncbi:MAG: dodecin [Desulfatiglandales bacterium]|jgi:flavin-binding protein dodecin
MDEHIYTSTELTGSSKKSIEDAIQNAIARASKTVPNMRWFEVVESRGYIEEGMVSYWQVTIKIGSTL